VLGHIRGGPRDLLNSGYVVLVGVQLRRGDRKGDLALRRIIGGKGKKRQRESVPPNIFRRVHYGVKFISSYDQKYSADAKQRSSDGKPEGGVRRESSLPGE